MILTLELILLIVYGMFCFGIVKGAERTNKNLKERNVHLIKRIKSITDENDRLHYEADKFSQELQESEAQAEALSRELMKSVENADALKEENLALSIRLQKESVKNAKAQQKEK